MQTVKDLFINTVTLPSLPWLMLATFTAGFIDAIGGGGGLISVPALLHTGLPNALILGTNKGSSTLGSLVALLRYRRAGLLPKLTREHILALMALAVFFGAMGALLATATIYVTHLKIIASVFLILALTSMMKKWFFSSPSVINAEYRINKRVIAALAGIAFYDGLFGPGTGTFFLSTLEHAGIDTLSANALTKGLNFASNLGALIIFAFYGRVFWPVSFAMLTTFVIGNFLGSGMVIKHGVKWVRVVVIVVTIAMVVKLLLT